MNKHGVLLLTTSSAERIFHVVAYEDTPLQRQLQLATRGDTLHLKLRRLEGRASVYRASQPTEETAPEENHSQTNYRIDPPFRMAPRPEDADHPHDNSIVSTDSSNPPLNRVEERVKNNG